MYGMCAKIAGMNVPQIVSPSYGTDHICIYMGASTGICPLISRFARADCTFLSHSSPETTPYLDRAASEPFTYAIGLINSTGSQFGTIWDIQKDLLSQMVILTQNQRKTWESSKSNILRKISHAQIQRGIWNQAMDHAKHPKPQTYWNSWNPEIRARWLYISPCPSLETTPYLDRAASEPFTYAIGSN